MRRKLLKDNKKAQDISTEKQTPEEEKQEEIVEKIIQEKSQEEEQEVKMTPLQESKSQQIKELEKKSIDKIRYDALLLKEK